MIEYLVAILLGTFALGITSWHITRVISVGKIFESFRGWLEDEGLHPDDGLPQPGVVGLVYLLFSCRLCLGTQVSIVLTWGALAAILAADWQQPVLPVVYWFFAFAVGPFLTAGWAEVVRRVECLETP